MDDERGSGEDLVTTITDAIEELLVTVIESVRERPSVALALLAGVAGACVGLALAGVGREKRQNPLARLSLGDMLAGLAGAVDVEERTKRVSKEVEKTGSRLDRRSAGLFSALGDLRNARDLVPVALQLLENPLVRSYLRDTVAKQLRKRFS